MRKREREREREKIFQKGNPKRVRQGRGTDRPAIRVEMTERRTIKQRHADRPHPHHHRLAASPHLQWPSAASEKAKERFCVIERERGT